MLIAQLTDLHVRPIGQAANRVVETNMLTERAFRAVMARPPLPDVVLLTGDLADQGLAEEYAVLAELIARTLPLPVFAIPGNHDNREVMLACLPGARQEAGDPARQPVDDAAHREDVGDRLPVEQVRVIFTRGSGCYGINGADTVSYDAALLSQATGKPVRVQLSRRRCCGRLPRRSFVRRAATHQPDRQRIVSPTSPRFSLDRNSQTIVNEGTTPLRSCSLVSYRCVSFYGIQLRERIECIFDEDAMAQVEREIREGLGRVVPVPVWIVRCEHECPLTVYPAHERPQIFQRLRLIHRLGGEANALDHILAR